MEKTDHYTYVVVGGTAFYLPKPKKSTLLSHSYLNTYYLTSGDRLAVGYIGSVGNAI